MSSTHRFFLSLLLTVLFPAISRAAPDDLGAVAVDADKPKLKSQSGNACGIVRRAGLFATSIGESRKVVDPYFQAKGAGSAPPEVLSAWQRLGIKASDLPSREKRLESILLVEPEKLNPDSKRDLEIISETDPSNRIKLAAANCLAGEPSKLLRQRREIAENEQIKRAESATDNRKIKRLKDLEKVTSIPNYTKRTMAIKFGSLDDPHSFAVYYHYENFYFELTHLPYRYHVKDETDNGAGYHIEIDTGHQRARAINELDPSSITKEQINDLKLIAANDPDRRVIKAANKLLREKGESEVPPNP